MAGRRSFRLAPKKGPFCPAAPRTFTFCPPGSRYPPPAAGPLNADIRRGFEFPRTIEPAWRSSFERGLGAKRLFGFALNHNRLTKDAVTNDGFQPVQIPAGSALGDRQGHLADPPRDDDYHHHGVRDGGAGLDLLLRRGSDHPLPRHLPARHPLMTSAGTQTMDKRWYIVHAYSNFEKKVAESIREQSKQRGLEELFEQVLVPTEKVTEVRRGRKVDAERKFFPGYVLVKMKLTDEAFHLIKNTPKVTGFLGAENKPMPISEAEAMRILHQVQEGVERPKASVSFEIGENVRVADGPFASFSGVVEEIDEARSRVKVAVSIFGRATPVELEFGQVEKV